MPFWFGVNPHRGYGTSFRSRHQVINVPSKDGAFRCINETMTCGPVVKLRCLSWCFSFVLKFLIFDDFLIFKVWSFHLVLVYNSARIKLIHVSNSGHFFSRSIRWSCLCQISTSYIATRWTRRDHLTFTGGIPFWPCRFGRKLREVCKRHKKTSSRWWIPPSLFWGR